jgi:hypothetical protein
MSSHRSFQNRLSPFRVLVIPSLLLLAACQSATSMKTIPDRSATGVALSGRNTLSTVAITTGDNVTMTGTTVDGRRIKAQGRTTTQAVNNLDAAANASR